MKVSILSLFLIFISLPAFCAGDITFKKAEELLKKNGISNELTRTSYTNLRSYLESLKEQLEEKLKDEGLSKSQKKDTKNNILFYQTAIDLLKQGINEVPAKRQGAFIYAKRIFYSVKSQEHVGRKVSIAEMLRTLTRLTTSIPYLSPEKRKVKIGLTQAKKESKFLIDPQYPHSYIPIHKLKHYSAQEISELDISNRHPVWRNNDEISKHDNYWLHLEKWATNQQKEVISNKYGEVKEEYNFHKARKVLFMDEIKTSATSPKVNTKDAYGQKWKLKWGNEVQIEPVGNRLYSKIGGRFTDLVYANPAGGDGVVLILGDKDETEDCQENIVTVEKFKSCLLSSNYKFNVSPFILNSGTITKENQDEILKNLSNSGVKKYKLKKIIGREFVTFKESMVEFKSSKVILNAGPAAGSFFGAKEDRVGRSLIVFNMWLWNLDAKDENNKTILAKNFNGEENFYMEYMHDFGASVGFPGRSGDLNSFKVDGTFMKVGTSLLPLSPSQIGSNITNYNPFTWIADKVPLRKKIFFNEFVLYRPKAWEKTTFSDALWMAKKIVSLSTNDIKEVVKHTMWPDYMQAAFANKLILRRNIIAKVFNIMDLLDENEVAPLNISIDLSTKEKRSKVAKQYQLDLTTLEAQLKKHGLLNQNYIDKVIVNNQVVSCKKSLISNLLEKKWYPSGLTRRMERAKDDRPLTNCIFRKKLLQRSK